MIVDQLPRRWRQLATRWPAKIAFRDVRFTGTASALCLPGLMDERCTSALRKSPGSGGQLTARRVDGISAIATATPATAAALLVSVK